MRKKSQAKMFYGIVAVIAVVGVIYMISQADEITRDDTAITFEIPIPQEALDFTGQTSLNSNASILCTIKHTQYGIDSTGGTVSTIQSKAVSGNPLLDLATVGGVKMAGYVADLRAFCENTFNDDNLNDPDRFTFVFDPSAMSIQVQSTDKDGSKKSTHFASFTSKSAQIPIGGNEVSLGTVGIYASQIEDSLQTGCYETLNEFNIRGNIVVYWKGYAGVKYEIPIRHGDINSFHKAQILSGSCNTGEYTGDDADGDGIKDQYDQCPNDAEIYNGVKDGDGCPDTSSNDTDPTPDPTPDPEPNVTQQECNNDGKTWYVDSNNNSAYCGTLYTLNGGSCDVYNVSTKTCDAGTAIDTSDTSNSLDGKMLWQVDIDYGDGSNGAFLAKDDPSPLEFSIPLDLLGGTSVGESRQIVEFTPQAFLLFDDPAYHKLVTTKSASLTAQVWAKVGTVWTKISEEPMTGFLSTNGASAENGIKIGEITLKATDIQNAIPSELVADNTSEDMTLKVIVNGNVMIEFNDSGTVRQIDIRIARGTGATSADNTLSGETEFVWYNLKYAKGTAVNDLETTGEELETKQKCSVDEIGISLNDGEVQCLPKGTDIGDGDGDGINDFNGICPLDSKNEDTNGDGIICLICTDEASGVGGFPCDDGYRADYCNDTTECNAPEAGDVIDGVDVTGTGGDPNACPTNISSDECILQGDTTPDIINDGTSPDVTIGGETVGDITGDGEDDTLLIGLIISVILAIVIAVIAKKKFLKKKKMRVR